MTLLSRKRINDRVVAETMSCVMSVLMVTDTFMYLGTDVTERLV
jgi:hypothetical protein